MIVGIKGKIDRVEATSLHIDSGTLIYEVFVSINTSNGLAEGESIKLLTTHIIREDAQLLYGFIDRNEKKMFDRLIKINGVGAKVAMAVCSTFSPSTFAEIINHKDVTMLKKVVGVGPKSANRILIELAEFTIDGIDNLDTTARAEATMALESLGFKREHITEAIAGVTGDTQTIVKEALRKLHRL